MIIERLRVRNLRVFEELEIVPDAGINWIHGGNGAGKSSLLEAIFLLCRGNSFRKGNARPAIREGRSEVCVYGECRDAGNSRYRIGLEKGVRGLRIRVNEKDVSRTSDLVRLVPVQLITANAHEILERGPDYRRKLVDWGVFHVEHAYRTLYLRYQHALKQRNASLRAGDRSFVVWEPELDVNGSEVDRFRARYVCTLENALRRTIGQIQALGQVQLKYFQGWDSDLALSDALKKNRLRDQRRKQTTVGPHKADLLITIDGKPAVNLLSRGEQKLFLALLRFAQGQVIREQTGNLPLVLIDDFSAELDAHFRELLYEQVISGAAQSFITVIDDPRKLLQIRSSDAMFHVEHGAVRRIQ